MSDDPWVNRDVLPKGYTFHWYEIVSVLGQGAFGVTYLTKDTNLDQLTAVKEYFPVSYATRVSGYTVHPTEGQNRDMYQWGLERFIKEARVLAKFKHPNIVRVYSVFEQNNTAYIVMEYEQGDNLSTVYKNSTDMSERALLDIFLPILNGLRLIHNEGFIHRDIKPSNIFMRRQGTPVLIDFGSARQVSLDATHTITALVTPGYAPLEQFNEGDEAQGPWTDIYSLGACLYLAIRSRLPVDARTRSLGLINRGADPYEPLAALDLAGNYSAHFLRAIDQALSLPVNDRPQDVVTWADMLSGRVAVLDRTVVQTRHDNTEDDVDKTIVRRPSPPPDGAGIQPDSADSRGGADTGPAAPPHRPASSPAKLVSVVVLLLVAVIGAGAFYFSSGAGSAPAGISASLPPVHPEQVRNQAKPTPAPIPKPRPSRLGQLLAQAHDQLDAGRLVAPPGDNAYESYTEALKQAPGNVTARAGIDKIIQSLLALAESQSRDGDLKESRATAEQALKIAPDNTQLQSLRSRVQDQIQAQLKQEQQRQALEHWLADAKRAFIKGSLISPEGRSALHYYRLALKSHSGNDEAQRGIRRIDDRLRSEFAHRQASGDLHGAERLLGVIDKAMPGSAIGRDLHRQLRKRKADIEKDAVNKTIDQFKSSFEGHQYDALSRISEYKPGRENFVKLIMNNYSSYKIMVFDLRATQDRNQRLATVRINNLLNNNGEPVQPGSWNRFNIEIRKGPAGHWRIVW